MLTSKQRSYLRGLSNNIVPIFQVGKNGIEENFLKQVEDALEVRELIKISILQNSEYTARVAAIICGLSYSFTLYFFNSSLIFKKSSIGSLPSIPEISIT